MIAHSRNIRSSTVEITPKELRRVIRLAPCALARKLQRVEAGEPIRLTIRQYADLQLLRRP